MPGYIWLSEYMIWILMKSLLIHIKIFQMHQFWLKNFWNHTRCKWIPCFIFIICIVAKVEIAPFYFSAIGHPGEKRTTETWSKPIENPPSIGQIFICAPPWPQNTQFSKITWPNFHKALRILQRYIHIFITFATMLQQNLFKWGQNHIRWGQKHLSVAGKFEEVYSNNQLSLRIFMKN